MKKQPTVLVCPLDWGIGHATRCVPVIRELINQGAKVIIGASDRPLAFLKNEFPQLEFIDFPGYQVSYPSENKGMVFKILGQLPKLLTSIRKENLFLDKIITSRKIDMVISDNRYGLHSGKIPCVFMTHQVFIKTPASFKFTKPFLSLINKRFIKKYTECWIPDFENEPNLSGDLSHGKTIPKNTFFIGPLSRFSLEKEKNPKEYHYDVLALLSGPEPQRTILENKMLNEFSELQLKAVMVCGKPEESGKNFQKENLDIFQHLESDQLKKLILQSEIIISRPGYSTLMDLSAMGKKALFIPTPGQTEQEYLGDMLLQKKLYYSIPQSKLNLKEDLKKARLYPGILLENDYRLLKHRLTQIWSIC